ncbi:MAG TPA: GNAT family N-acyltransferase [Nevskiales bacterium]|nr:GNAT family N-acyltransferase [Nevskiales bacterium]
MSAVVANITRSAPAASRFRVGLAYTPEEVLETQRLRYRVFAEEMGAQIRDGGQRIDRDWLDHFCHHLLVRDTETGEVVASTRLLTDAQAQAAGGFYSAQEFDLRNILALPGRKLEVGRTCVHPDYRNGAVIALLWAGLAEFVRERGFAWLFGCASIELSDGGARAHAIARLLTEKHLAPIEARAEPRIRLPRTVPPLPCVRGTGAREISRSANADAAAAPAPTLCGTVSQPSPRLPPLLKAYLSLGAKVCGPPYWDAQFGTADILVLVQVEDLSPRYARHFIQRSSAPITVRAGENRV